MLSCASPRCDEPHAHVTTPASATTTTTTTTTVAVLITKASQSSQLSLQVAHFLRADASVQSVATRLAPLLLPPPRAHASDTPLTTAHANDSVGAKDTAEAGVQQHTLIAALADMPEPLATCIMARFPGSLGALLATLPDTMHDMALRSILGASSGCLFIDAADVCDSALGATLLAHLQDCKQVRSVRFVAPSASSAAGAGAPYGAAAQQLAASTERHAAKRSSGEAVFSFLSKLKGCTAVTALTCEGVTLSQACVLTLRCAWPGPKPCIVCNGQLVVLHGIIPTASSCHGMIRTAL